MRRTQLYLTDEQRRRLEQRAREAGLPMAAVVREILDQALGIDDEGARLAAADEAFGILDDSQSWQEFLARVRRAGGANARLRELGLS